TSISFLPPFSRSTSITVAPASIAFSTSSFTTEAGRSTTSPAAIWLMRSEGRRWMWGTGGLSQFEHNLPERLARFEDAMSFGDLGQGQDAVDDGSEAAGFDELHDLVQFGQASHRRAQDGEQLEEDQAEVDRYFASRGRAGSARTSRRRRAR